MTRLLYLSAAALAACLVQVSSDAPVPGAKSVRVSRAAAPQSDAPAVGVDDGLPAAPRRPCICLPRLY
ncbi:MAG: hypothetical protein WDM81_02400 [Rhizomicrobium sp.]